MGTFNWGIIGPGAIARDFADDLKFVSSRQKVTSVLSHRKESAQEFADDYQVETICTNIEQFISNRNFDAVYIATPHTIHFEQAKACLENKIPVLCEKPLVINAKQAEELISTSRANNTFLLDGMWIRFLPSIRKVLQLIEAGEIGKVLSVQASMSFLAPKDPKSRYFDPELGGGSLLDLGVYPVFLSHLVLGNPESIYAIAKLSEQGIDESCAALFRYKDGQHAAIGSSIISATELDAEIAGDKGTIRILSAWNEKPKGIRVAKPGEETKQYPCEWKGRGFQYEVEEMIACLKDKRTESPLLPHQFSLDILRSMDEIRKQINVRYASFE